jgi:hypothetical protein
MKVVGVLLNVLLVCAAFSEHFIACLAWPSAIISSCLGFNVLQTFSL